MRKTVIVKLTGNLIKTTDQGMDTSRITAIARQVKTLSDCYTFGIVIGGGNFFRGARQSKDANIKPQTGHAVGMLATMMNGLIIQDLFEQEGIATTLFSAVPCPSVGKALSPQALSEALRTHNCLIFSGGTGNPYFSTDTTAVVRALQIDADEIWKGTKVDGVYTADPKRDPEAKLLKEITYKQVLEKKLTVMDATAFALAEAHAKVVRVFNIFTEDALIKSAREKDFGSTITV